jgi:2-polyprenyl-3-methyl-5-hydroxy-6-metoxy-1,4-benzoquinol methylase
MPEKRSDVQAHYNAVASDYYKQYQRENLNTLESYPANYFRLEILVNRLAQSGAKSVYEVGVGEGTPLVTLAKMGFEVAGCDISESMVETAKDHFSRAGLSPERIQWADIEDSITFANQLTHGPFDAVIAAGVLPHVKNDALFLQNIRMLLPRGGKVFVEFRNKFFSLFTLNRYTKEFILDDLLVNVDSRVRDAVAKELDSRLATDVPAPRLETSAGQPGYDAILSKFHNPFELTEEFESAGFKNPRVHWYHYHPAPPMMEGEIGPLYREEGLRLEHESSGWRGYFLCSAGVIEADLIND